jgi:hypothetical protein
MKNKIPHLSLFLTQSMITVMNDNNDKNQTEPSSVTKAITWSRLFVSMYLKKLIIALSKPLTSSSSTSSATSVNKYINKIDSPIPAATSRTGKPTFFIFFSILRSKFNHPFQKKFLTSPLSSIFHLKPLEACGRFWCSRITTNLLSHYSQI